MAKIKKSIWAFSLPVHWLCLQINRIYRHDIRHSKLVIGVILVFIGAGMAQLEPHSGKFILDGVAWTIHGAGAAPVVEYILGFFGGER